MLNRLFWMAVMLSLVGAVVLFGLALNEGMHQHPSVHPNMQESFTIPMNDRSDAEIAVYGPDTIIEEA